jgi:hypothetical protein
MRSIPSYSFILAATAFLFACGAPEEALDGDPTGGDVATADDSDYDVGLDDIGQIDSELTSVSISNAGFESDFTGWTRVSPTGITTVPHSGSKAAKLSSTTGQIKRTITGLKGGTKYTVSAYIKGYARIGVRNFGGTNTSRSISTTSYTKLSVSFTTGSSSTSAEIYSSWVGGGDARVDDFSLVIASTTTTTTSTTCGVPGQLLDMSPWKLQLPTGSPIVEIKLPTLATYSNNPYFRVNSACTAVRFRAPTSGTTTSGSQYPRSELREMAGDGTVQMQWSTTSGTHRMYIDQAVTALPRGKSQMSVGQIHNGDNDIVMIRVEGSRLIIKPNGFSAHVLDSNYTLGKRFRIEYVASGGKISVYYNGSSSPVFTMSRSTTTAYFKAGAYTQSNCDTEAAAGEQCGSDNYGETEIYDLWIRHQ